MYFPVVGYGEDDETPCGLGSSVTGLAPTNGIWDKLIYDGTVLFAPSIPGNGTGNNLIRSTNNGSTWDNSTSLGIGTSINTCTTDGSSIFIYGFRPPGSTNTVWISGDHGASVTPNNITGIAWIPAEVNFCGSVFIGAKNQGTGVALTDVVFGLSADGIDFAEIVVTATGLGSNGTVHRRIGYSSDLNQIIVLCCGQTTGKAFCFVSDDLGTTWDQVALPSAIRALDICWNGNVWCIVGFSNTNGNTTTCFTSSDGRNWTSRTTAFGLQNIAVKALASGTLLAYPRANGGAATNRMNLSLNDGVTWMSCTMPVTAIWGDAAVNPAANLSVLLASSTNAEVVTQF